MSTATAGMKHANVKWWGGIQGGGGNNFLMTGDWAVELPTGTRVIAMDRVRVDLSERPPTPGEIYVFRGKERTLVVFKDYPLYQFGNRIPEVVAHG